MVALTCRTEYLGQRQRIAATTGFLSMIAALICLVVLNIAGVSGMVTAGVAVALVAVSTAAVAFGRLSPRGAVLLTADDDTVYLGDEDRMVVSRPLDTLTTMTLDGPSTVTTATGREGDPHDLTIAGLRYLTLTFRGEPGADAVASQEVWRVAVVESDPAAAELISRLRRYAPEPRRASKTKAKAEAEPGARTAADARATVAGVIDGEVVTDTRTADPSQDSRGPRVADAGSDDAAERLWEEATRRHDEVLRDYGAYELDPEMMLRYPAVTDVTVEATQTFHLALDEATALRTDAYPGSRSRADAYQQSVAALRRAWIACEANGRKVGATYLDKPDRDDLDTALKLYRHAEASSTPAEAASYYGRVRDIVATLADRGVLRPPKAALAELEAVTRRALEPGGSGS